MSDEKNHMRSLTPKSTGESLPTRAEPVAYNSTHAVLECPECGRPCRPKKDNKDGGSSYVCHNIIRHADSRDLRFRIDGVGELHY